MKRLFVLAISLLVSFPAAEAQTPAAKVQHEANFDAEHRQANDLFVAGKILESLPLYEDLCRQDQTVAVFAERHATGLLTKAATLPDGPAQQEVQRQAIAELNRAKALGDNSTYLQAQMDAAAKTSIGAIISGIPLTVGYSYRGNAQAKSTLKDAEIAFANRDIERALSLYQQAAKQDPAWYSPPLFAGDMFFRMKNWIAAGTWFEEAIAIDPDRETAYRYWGDALYHSGDVGAAKLQYERAVVAEPYFATPWNMLRQWANLTKTSMVVPMIAPPNFVTPNGKLSIDPVLTTETGDGRSSWLVYQKARVAHGARFNRQIPMLVAGLTMANGDFVASSYRHSLTEEVECLNAMLEDLQLKMKSGIVTEEKLDPALKQLLELKRDGMLECWVLLNGSDGGIVHDYSAYRKDHRDQLVTYIDRYILGQHP